MKRIAKGDDTVTPRGGARNLNGILYRFSTGAEKRGFHFTGDRNQIVNAFRQRNIVLIRRDLESGMGKLL